MQHAHSTDLNQHQTLIERGPVVFWGLLHWTKPRRHFGQVIGIMGAIANVFVWNAGDAGIVTSPLPQGVGERLHLLRPKSETDLLWCVEETLRAAPVGLVIAEPSQPLSLTAGRRFQLAAEAGGTTGLMLIQTDAGSNATESRWKCEPQASDADSTLHHWICKKNKKGTLGNWVLNWNGASTAFHMVSEAGERHQSAGQAQ